MAINCLVENNVFRPVKPEQTQQSHKSHAPWQRGEFGDKADDHRPSQKTGHRKGIHQCQAAGIWQVGTSGSTGVQYGSPAGDAHSYKGKPYDGCKRVRKTTIIRMPHMASRAPACSTSFFPTAGIILSPSNLPKAINIEYPNRPHPWKYGLVCTISFI